MSGVPAWLDPRDDRVARAAWTRLAEPGDAAAGRVVSALGAGPALLAVVERPEELSLYLKDARSVAGWRVRLGQAQPLRDLETVARFGGSLVIPSDPDWPPGLAALGEREPFALWVRGPASPAVPVGRTVALVGCRASSGYGDWVAAEFAAACADRGVTVVSGAAYGIDAQAHRGALAAGGPTTAVLACGVDRPYPRGNEDLIERIAGSGAVLSEVPPGSSPTRWRFVTRNRLILSERLASAPQPADRGPGRGDGRGGGRLAVRLLDHRPGGERPRPPGGGGPGPGDLGDVRRVPPSAARGGRLRDRRRRGHGTAGARRGRSGAPAGGSAGRPRWSGPGRSEGPRRPSAAPAGGSRAARADGRGGPGDAAGRARPARVGGPGRPCGSGLAPGSRTAARTAASRESGAGVSSRSVIVAVYICR